MIAYNKIWLDNLWVQREAGKAYDQACITKVELETIKQTYPAGFYMPNPFVRIGLFILTIIIAFFSLALFSLLFISASLKGFGALSIFFGLLTYGALEFMVSKNHYKSGVDDALLWMSAGFIVGGLNAVTNIPPLGNAIIIFILAFYLTLRFTDMLMSAVTCVALLAIVFFSYIKIGFIAKATMPFLLMIISCLIYWFIKNHLQKEKWKHYFNCFIVVCITALVCFYIEGNYYVVREASISMFGLSLKEGESISFGWLFWILTVLVPLTYIFRGIQKKDPVLLRTGLLLVAAIIFTIRYYYHVVSIEMAMVIGGIIMIGIAYALIKYLTPPKYGFTYQEQPDKLFIDKLQIESLVIAQTFSGTSQPDNSGTQFGGGSGGGGGATGDF
jgi:uncharacterized membrane protein YgcG